ncbi:hypothetical protein PoB_007441400 [Plakobranchus ocellatus]|uniref:Uncharacterized protein n=1 Tax=Plakobranchus ocellatus TaxID=259542 RepID=A0AAV4DV73_9GAST|nr:hypothetical protein PoB_007441400 [Plakobranchus ocellatus]
MCNLFLCKILDAIDSIWHSKLRIVSVWLSSNRAYGGSRLVMLSNLSPPICVFVCLQCVLTICAQKYRLAPRRRWATIPVRFKRSGRVSLPSFLPLLYLDAVLGQVAVAILGDCDWSRVLCLSIGRDLVFSFFALHLNGFVAGRVRWGGDA